LVARLGQPTGQQSRLELMGLLKLVLKLVLELHVLLLEHMDPDPGKILGLGG